MSQTRENRMLLHYRSLKKSQDYRNGPNLVWMTLARTWRTPIREVREIIELKKMEKQVDAAHVTWRYRP